MSGMLRAHKAGGGGGGGRGGNGPGSAGKHRQARSLTLTSDSSPGESSDSDLTGARLSVGNFHDSPHRVRFSSITEEFTQLSVASSDGASRSGRGSIASPYQFGDNTEDDDDDDVFLASPVRRALRGNQTLAAQIGDNTRSIGCNTPRADHEHNHHRGGRSATTPVALSALGATPGDRAFRTPAARHAMTPRNVTGPHNNGLVARTEEEPVDAQGIYPPSACVFIANLPESKDDRALEAAVTREFSRFGTVFVKIRREGRGNITGMPYAFAQFTNDEDARTAMEQGKGLMILGRPCRTEMVKANRAFVIYNRHGEEITPQIARGILAPYGALKRCEMLPAHIQESLGLPPAVLVEFRQFDPRRDLNNAVRRSDLFRIDAFDMETRTTIARPNPDEEFLRRYDQDRRSIFVGNLPADITKEELVEFFSQVSEVVDVNLITRPNYFSSSTRAFAFVEFTRIDVPDVAIDEFNGTNFRGNVLKIERKASRRNETPRRVRSQAFTRNAATPRTPRADNPVRTPMESRSTGTLRSGPGPFGSASTARFSGRRELPGRPATQQGYDASPLVPPPAPTLSFAVPNTEAPPPNQPLIGASGLPVTPSSFTNAPFSWSTGYWPGTNLVQDPVSGQTFWAYTPPVGSGGAPPAPSPTRGPARNDQHFYGA